MPDMLLAPDVVASVRRGLADAGAGRTVALDEAEAIWSGSGERRREPVLVHDVLLPGISIGLAIAAAAYLLAANASRAHSVRQTEDTISPAP